MKSAIRALCIVDIVVSAVCTVLFLVLTIITFGIMLFWFFFFLLGLIFASVELSQTRHRKPMIGVSICLILFGNIFGIIAAIMALAIDKKEYEPVVAPYMPQPGYPPQQPTGYGYPPQQQAPGYGYPPQQQAPGYGYPPQTSNPYQNGQTDNKDQKN